MTHLRLCQNAAGNAVEIDTSMIQCRYKEVSTMTTTLQEYSFISDADALEISVLRCTPAGRPRAIIQLVHGMAEHKERYIDFMQ